MIARTLSSPPAGQRGLGSPLAALLAVVLVFITLSVIKLYPPWYEYFNVRSSLTSLVQEPGVADLSPAEVRSMLWKRFQVNQVSSVNRRDVVIETGAEGHRITVDYEVRMNWFANVDLVFRFHRTELARR